MDTWAQLAQSALQVFVGLGGGSALWVTLVLTGKLTPHKVTEDRITDLKANQVKELENRDRENERLASERDYERKAKDVERERADANADRLAAVVREFGETTVHLLRALPEAADDA